MMRCVTSMLPLLFIGEATTNERVVCVIYYTYVYYIYTLHAQYVLINISNNNIRRIFFKT